MGEAPINLGSSLCSKMNVERSKLEVSERIWNANIAYIGGGSLNWAPKLMSDLAADGRVSGEVRLFDLNLAAAKRNETIGNRIAQTAPDALVRYKAVSDIGEALEGADIVVISILPGGFDAMACDIDIPARFGIKQAVGDTVGPGGFIRALRSILPLYEVGRSIQKYAPDAYVCNLTNPMSVLTGALFKAFPEIKAWGECHEAVRTRKVIARLANEGCGEQRYAANDVILNVKGINHFTFVDKMAVDGVDLTDAYHQFARDHKDSGWQLKPIDDDDEFGHYFEDHFKVKFDLFERFGVMAAAGDRHLAEFMPQSEYLESHARWGFALTPIEFRKRDGARKASIATELAQGGNLPPNTKSDEAWVDQVVALLGGSKYVSNVNLPNEGQLTGLAHGAIVETNAVFSSLGIQPVVAGTLPAPLNEIVKDHSARQTALLDAVVEKNGKALFPLFASDPLVSPLGEEKAAELSPKWFLLPETRFLLK